MNQKKVKKLNNSMSDRSFNVLMTVIASIWLLIVTYPCIYIISSSFSLLKNNWSKILI